ncbi:MAG: helix-turn-helix domain-containing protein [Elusimicrobia bacterium]|nr:helix-turn-helix domain-containing protein [Elusimicrobiota bacterium]
MNTQIEESKRLLTPKETAQYLAVSQKTVYKWVFFRKIPCVKLGKALRFDKTEIDRWVDGQRKAGAPAV